MFLDAMLTLRMGLPSRVHLLLFAAAMFVKKPKCNSNAVSPAVATLSTAAIIVTAAPASPAAPAAPAAAASGVPPNDGAVASSNGVAEVSPTAAAAAAAASTPASTVGVDGVPADVFAGPEDEHLSFGLGPSDDDEDTAYVRHVLAGHSSR